MNPPSPPPSSSPAPCRPAALDYDVVVVGARPAGAATALLLAGHGLRTLVLDAGRLGTDTLSTHALMRGGVLQLSRWGLLDAVVAAGTPPVRRTTFIYGHDRAAITIRPSAGVDALYAPRRTVLDPLLVSAARAAGAEVVDRMRVTDLLRAGQAGQAGEDGGRVTGVRAVPAPAGGAADAGGPPIDITARLVVGADGIASTVARLAGAAVTRQGANASAFTYGYWDGVEVDGYHWVFRPDGCAGLIPTNGGRTVVFAGGTPARVGRGGTRLITDVVAAGAADLAGLLDQGRAPATTRTWAGHPGFMRRAHGPGWALVGDAGYYKDPISAHGLTDALRDAELLARAVIGGWIGGWAPARPTTSLDEALAGYGAERDRLSLPLFDVVDRIAGHRWDDREIADLLLRLSSAMADEVETLAGLEPLGSLSPTPRTPTTRTPTSMEMAS